jgi:AcrR family transcriptional regulator
MSRTTPTETRRRPGGRSARVRRAVLDATIDAVAHSGVVGLTVEDIADRSGVHKTTVYRRWPSLDDLVVEALLDRAEEHVPVPDKGNLRSDLLAFVGAVAANITSPTGRALISATGQGGSAALDRLREQFWTSRFALVRTILDRARDRGEISPTVDPDLLIELVVAPLYFRLLISHKPLSPKFRADVVDAVLRSARG